MPGAGMQLRPISNPTLRNTAHWRFHKTDICWPGPVPSPRLIASSRCHSRGWPQEVTRWEGTLAALSEAVEVILQVQRSWMYLESIFGGSEDIRKQLPSETTLFEGVDASFTRAMRELKAAGNVVAATTRKGLLAAFQVWPIGRGALARATGQEATGCSLPLPQHTACRRVQPPPVFHVCQRQELHSCGLAP